MQLFSADAMIFSKKNFFALENIKKTPLKVAHNRPQAFFHKYGPAAQTSPELIFHIIKCREQASVLLSVEYIMVSEKSKKSMTYKIMCNSLSH